MSEQEAKRAAGAAAHTPGKWEAHAFHVVAVDTFTRKLPNGETYKVSHCIVERTDGDTEAEAQANAARIAACVNACAGIADPEKTIPELLAALRGLLAQAEGPAMVYGDGRGNDGTKTGLSHEEFCALRQSRVEAARAAIRAATDE